MRTFKIWNPIEQKFQVTTVEKNADFIVEKTFSEINTVQIVNMRHALKNQNRFYTSADDPDWNDLVLRGYAIKRPGWEDGMAFFRVTHAGESALKMQCTEGKWC